MTKDLAISLIQAPLYWESPEKNRSEMERRMASAVSAPVDVFVLPEMFTTGFTMKAMENAEPTEGPTTDWLRETAGKLNAVVCGSLIIEEQGRYYNRFLWAPPDGPIQYYDKKHLFRMAGEHEHYTAGTERLVVEIKGWKVCPMVCYDLRFPEWSRNKYAPDTGAPDYDVLLYAANWPAVRSAAWDTLLKARAIENLAYCAGVNRTGTDGNDVEYSGHSAVYDFTGKTIAFSEKEEILSVSVQKAPLDDFRKKFPAWLDADF